MLWFCACIFNQITQYHPSETRQLQKHILVKIVNIVWVEEMKKL